MGVNIEWLTIAQRNGLSDHLKVPFPEKLIGHCKCKHSIERALLGFVLKNQGPRSSAGLDEQQPITLAGIHVS